VLGAAIDRRAHAAASRLIDRASVRASARRSTGRHGGACARARGLPTALIGPFADVGRAPGEGHRREPNGEPDARNPSHREGRPRSLSITKQAAAAPGATR
jgi:hypothetical protein